MATKLIKVKNNKDVIDYLTSKKGGYELSEILEKENTITILADSRETKIRVDIGKKLLTVFEGSYYTQSNPLRSGTLKIPLTGRSVINVEVKEKKTGPVGSVGLLPGDINPKIDGHWITPDDLIKNVTSYIQKSSITDDGKKEIFRVLKGTQSTSTMIAYDADTGLISSEFFEILTAVRVCTLLEREKSPQSGKGISSSGIRKVLGIPAQSTLSGFKIYYPVESNFPLVDFFVNVYAESSSHKLPTGDPINWGGDGILRISVKNKVKSENVNTIKFKFAFDDKQNRNPQPDYVEKWYSSIKDTNKKQLAQKIIAKSSLEVPKEYAGREKLYTIFAMNELLKHRVIKKTIDNTMKKYKKGPLAIKDSKIQYIDSIKKLCSQIAKSEKGKVQYKTLISDFVDNKNFTKNDLDIINEFLDSNFTDKSGGTKTKNLDLFRYATEKIFQNSTSTKNKEINWNFYKMFYDKVLTKQQVCYAVTKVTSNRLRYQFSSRRNYKILYGDWLGLRSKSTDVLGMG